MYRRGDIMPDMTGKTGLVFGEPLLWEKGSPGRSGFSLPTDDTGHCDIDPALVGDSVDFPELSEGDVVRHFTRLSQWNICVDSGMYPLGSCTMKYSPKINEQLAGLSGFADLHPMLSDRHLQGLLGMMHYLEGFLAEITGMEAVSLQPAAGAQGELTGILVIHSWLKKRGEHRSKFIIPATAHGTNPASIAVAGFTPVKLASDDRGVIDPLSVAAIMDDDVAGIMITNPNTLGLFEENIRKVAEIVHERGGKVYCDGANLNAIMGIVRLGDLGVDVMHVNLHKTFSSPHGGGGPGSGPICVKSDLAPFLPVPRITKSGEIFSLSDNSPDSIGRVHGFFGNVGVMLRAYAYIISMGPRDLKFASEMAVLAANYIRQQLKDTYHLPYDLSSMHECVFTDKRQESYGVSTLDIAKRLIDYGFHPPTIYFPLVVHGAIMIEPTETESKETIDSFIAAMRAIALEAEKSPDLLHESPTKTTVRRLDETLAARNLWLRD